MIHTRIVMSHHVVSYSYWVGCLFMSVMSASSMLLDATAHRVARFCLSVCVSRRSLVGIFISCLINLHDLYAVVRAHTKTGKPTDRWTYVESVTRRKGGRGTGRGKEEAGIVYKTYETCLVREWMARGTCWWCPTSAVVIPCVCVCIGSV